MLTLTAEPSGPTVLSLVEVPDRRLAGHRCSGLRWIARLDPMVLGASGPGRIAGIRGFPPLRLPTTGGCSALTRSFLTREIVLLRLDHNKSGCVVFFNSSSADPNEGNVRWVTGEYPKGAAI